MKLKERIAAIELRKRGYSLDEIVRSLGVSKSSASVWIRNTKLSSIAEKRLLTKITVGQLASQKSKRAQTAIKEKNALDTANSILNNFTLTSSALKILCAMIYYCEGRKSLQEGVSFTNSDPKLISLFVNLLRKSFDLNEKKFRVCVHLHSYHDSKRQLKFWSKTTSIPLNQFIKPYLKPSSGMYKKEGYEGCINVSLGQNCLIF